MSGWKKKIEGYEVNLFMRPVKGLFRFPRARGELEYKKFEDETEEFEIKLKKLDLPVPEALVSIFVNDVEIAQVQYSGKSIFVELKTENGDTVPKATRGDEARVMYGEQLLCSGKFIKD